MFNKFNLVISKLVKKVDAGRYALGNVNFTPTHTEVTNGHFAVRVSTPRSEPRDLESFPMPEGHKAATDFKSFLLPSGDVETLTKAIPNDRVLTILNHLVVSEETNVNGKAVFVTNDLDSSQVIQKAKSDGQFPNVDLYLSSGKEPDCKAKVDSKYMTDLCKYFADFTKGQRNQPVTMSLYKTGDSCIVKFESEDAVAGQQMTAVLMSLKA